MPDFQLDPAFDTTSEALALLPLCAARLQLDARYVWIVLIPRRAGAVEIEDLSDRDRAALMAEVVLCGRAVRAAAATTDRPIDKLNVGQLGNLTRQLHVHVVGRRQGDPAWPGPVWGHGKAEPFGADTLEALRAALRTALNA